MMAMRTLSSSSTGSTGVGAPPGSGATLLEPAESPTRQGPTRQGCAVPTTLTPGSTTPRRTQPAWAGDEDPPATRSVPVTTSSRLYGRLDHVDAQSSTGPDPTPRDRRLL